MENCSWRMDKALKLKLSYYTPETKIAPETLGLEDEIPFGKASCQILCWFHGG